MLEIPQRRLFKSPSYYCLSGLALIFSLVQAELLQQEQSSYRNFSDMNGSGLRANKLLRVESQVYDAFSCDACESYRVSWVQNVGAQTHLPLWIQRRPVPIVAALKAQGLNPGQLSSGPESPSFWERSLRWWRFVSLYVRRLENMFMWSPGIPGYYFASFWPLPSEAEWHNLCSGCPRGSSIMRQILSGRKHCSSKLDYNVLHPCWEAGDVAKRELRKV